MHEASTARTVEAFAGRPLSSWLEERERRVRLGTIVSGPTDKFQPGAAPPTTLPVHHRNPRSTARKGSMRVKKPIREHMPRPLRREDALRAISSGLVDPAEALVLWNVADRPLLQDITAFQVPMTPDLMPVRRIGTYQGAQSRMGWFATERDGHAIFLETDSRTEQHCLRVLDMEPGVTWLHTQPFVIIWSTGNGSVLHTPDILALQHGQPRVVDVRPESRRDEYDESIFALTRRTLAQASVGFHVEGSPTPQSMFNHLVVRRWKRPNAFLFDLVQLVETNRPRTAHHALTLCGGHERGLPVLFHLRANARCMFDLTQAVHRATPIDWPEVIG